MSIVQSRPKQLVYTDQESPSNQQHRGLVDIDWETIPVCDKQARVLHERENIKG